MEKGLCEKSIRPSSFDDGRLEHGAATLMGILGNLAARGRESRLEDLADPLTRALARELRRFGVEVDVDYHGLLPLVARYRGKAVVAESDGRVEQLDGRALEDAGADGLLDLLTAAAVDDDRGDAGAVE